MRAQVSVVIPLYNKAPYIEATLRSVQAQSFEDLEIVVVDDGSSDNGAALVQRFEDPRVVLIRQRNAGVSAARNTGINAARGRWIALLDADDLWRRDKIAQQLRLLEAHPEVLWAAGASVRTLPGERSSDSPTVAPGLFVAEGVIRDALSLLTLGTAISTSSVMVRHDALRAVGGFDPTIRVVEDRDLWVRLAVENPRLAYISESIVVKREVAGSLTARTLAEGSIPAKLAGDLARRRIALARSLPPHRAALLRAFVRMSLEKYVRQEFAGHRPEAARQALSVMRTLDLGRPSWPIRVAAHLPDRVLPLLFTLRRRSRQRMSWEGKAKGRGPEAARPA
jgi:glycosyltransferase involved in cell wall biosynthesis